MMRYLAGIVAALWFAGAAYAQVGGSLVKYPPVDLRIDITNGPDGKPVLTPSEIRLVTGEYYRLTLSSDGAGKDERGEPLARRVELTEFLSNIHLRILTISGIEVHLQGMSFRAIELDEKGEASFTFTPMKPGDYPLYVGPNPISMGRPAGEAGVQNDSKVAFGKIHVE
ncbi:MAG: hypothetical protein Q8R82_09725 [Hyphomonadaceae bacterium]|nr:hypothetical protein [Hyphomonadaceae bacterium]